MINKMKIKKTIALLGMIFMLMITSNVYAQLDVNQENIVDEQDESLILTYVEYVNTGNAVNIPTLYCSQEEKVLGAILSNEKNKEENIGIYNVNQINGYNLIELKNYDDAINSDYKNVKEYLLNLECDVKESNQFFKSGDNYFRVLIGEENFSRKILELSVVSETQLEKIIESKTDVITEEKIIDYVAERNEVINNLNGFEIKMVDENISLLAGADYTPKSLASYAFPSTIKILNTNDNVIYTRNFKNYCYVVCAGEFGCGTDGETYAHQEALKAFSLCVKNVSWYRCLYPYNVTGGYNITDNTQTQVYDWNIENSVTYSYPRHKIAMDSTWETMMFDCAKKLFYASYRSGGYNGNENTEMSVFYQNGANYLATELNYNYTEILHYYYDDAIGEEITSGPIIVCATHNKALAYTKNVNGHGNACLTCGYITFTPHTYVKYNDKYYKCSVCGYLSDVSAADVKLK